MVKKSCSSRYVCTVFSVLNSLYLVIRVPSFLLAQGGYFSHGGLLSQGRKASVVFWNSFSLRFLTHEGALSGVACLEPHHKQLCTMNMPRRLSSIPITYLFHRLKEFRALSFVLGQKKISMRWYTTKKYHFFMECFYFLLYSDCPIHRRVSRTT